MKRVKFLLLLIGLTGIALLANSCKGPCDDIKCQNGGICIEGVCECPDYYTGADCASFDHLQIQALLDEGKTPLELVKNNIPLDVLYGKKYKGGLIYYLNTTDGTGLVAAIGDQSTKAEWGCYETDIMDIANALHWPIPNPDTEEGARLGDGKRNTDAILDAMCVNSNGTGAIAAKLCRNLGEEWFLPSREELNLMYINLHLKNLGNFLNSWYWSSTELNSEGAYGHNFNGGEQHGWVKPHATNVRAARAF